MDSFLSLNLNSFWDTITTMRFSQQFSKTRREAPKDEVSKNAQLLIRAGFIDKLQAGVYTYLPLGFKVLQKVEALIREEMSKIGGQELLLPSLHPRENWQKTGRWDTMDDLYKIKDTHGREFALAGTHEEVIVPLARQFVSSYKDLPLALYQIQNKFRMELRAKSGLLRGREFMMKDLYSFHADEKDFENYYDKVKDAYRNIFNAVGIGHRTYVTLSGGGTFSKYSHEFQTATGAGEDTIYLCEKCCVAVNKEIIEKQATCPKCGKGKKTLDVLRSIEVGNIFPLKSKFSDAFDLKYKDRGGNLLPVIMGSYGIGLGRLIGAVSEVLSDDKGLVWPRSLTPFQIHLIEVPGKKLEVRKKAEELYKKLQKRDIDILYDDREVSTGIKFADADLIGIPYQVIVSERTVAQKDVVELKERKTGEIKDVKITELLTEHISIDT